MKPTILKLLFITIFFTSCKAFASEILKGKVMAIADGDTFILFTDDKKQIRVRLYGIDSPEHGQDYGNTSRDYLSSLIYKQEVNVEDKGTDKYGRTLGIVLIGNENVNEAMLKAGMAWHYAYFDSNSVWQNDELTAQKLKLGLWQGKDPVAPWDWRSMHINYTAQKP